MSEGDGTLDVDEVAARWRRAPDRWIDVGAGEVAYRSFGAGPDVLFVHGWPVSGATWRQLVARVAPHVRCHVIDLPGAGSSRFEVGRDPITVDQHVRSVARVVDVLELDELAVVGHDSGGLIARLALAGDPRVRAMGLIDTEQPSGLSWRFRQFLVARHLPGFGRALRRLLSSPTLRRRSLVLGGAFHDRSLLDGDFDEFFLRPIVDDRDRLAAAISLLDSFDTQHIAALGEVHRGIDVPVQLVWGADDPFFPVAWAREMVDTFADAELAVIDGARLFAHEERPAEVAAALLPILTGTR